MHALPVGTQLYRLTVVVDVRRENRRQQIEDAQLFAAAVHFVEDFANRAERRVFFKFNGDNVVSANLVDNFFCKVVGEIFRAVAVMKLSVGANPFAAVEDFIQREHAGGVFFFGRRQIPILALGFEFAIGRHGNNHVLNVRRIFDGFDGSRHVDVVKKFFAALGDVYGFVGEERAEKRSQPLLSVKNQMTRRDVGFACAFNRAVRELQIIRVAFKQED